MGGINIDECRVGFSSDKDKWQPQQSGSSSRAYQSEETTTAGGLCEANDLGRFPANVITDGSDEVAKGFPGEDDSGSAMRYFYTAKASKKDRDEGLDEFENAIITDGRLTPIDNAFNRGETIRRNIHPTVKPVELMQYLVRLVSPKGSTILDCFMGSGSTGKAVMFENRERDSDYKFIGCEMTDEYLPIAKSRIIYGRDKFEYDFKKELEDKKKEGQMNIFDIMEEN